MAIMLWLVVYSIVENDIELTKGCYPILTCGYRFSLNYDEFASFAVASSAVKI